MKYLTTEELKTQHHEEAHEILEQCAGKSIRDRFAIDVFNRYHDRSFLNRAATKILDIGIASGTFFAEIAKDGYRELYGCDLDDYVKPGVKPLIREFNTLDLSTERLPWPESVFDVVTAWCVLPHLENPFFAVREIRRVLKPGGLFIFTTPYLESKPSKAYFAAHGDFRSYRATNNHIVLFPRGVVAKAILRYFEPVQTEYHARLWKIFRGPKGAMRRVLYRIAAMVPNGERALQRRWAYNVVYILKKPRT